jgi:hypothetical protein
MDAFGPTHTPVDSNPVIGVFFKYCNSFGLLDEGSIHDGSLLLTSIQLTTVSSINSTQSTIKQYVSEPAVSQQLPYSTCFIGDSSNRTVSGRLQHTTQDRTLRQSISLPASTAPQACTAQRSVSFASSYRTALEVQH